MKGWRTLVFNGAIAVGVALVQYVAGVNWTDYVSPSTALIITSLANMGLRKITDTPVGKA